MKLILHNTKAQYHNANKAEKGLILDQFCQQTNMHRKSVIRLFNRQDSMVLKKKRGRKSIYKSDELLSVLKRMWFASDQICGKRLKVIIPEWLSFYELRYGKVSPMTNKQLYKISSATIDRLLKPMRTHPKFCTTKPGSILRTQIPIKTNQWDESVPGFVEADTVAHCGESLSGDFMWSLTVTDIATAWTENRAIWGKGALSVAQAIEAIKHSLPFTLKGFDSDNGSEFLNHHLIAYCLENKMQMTRSRPYHKNDNAHVEQKNWTHVRQLLGYHRYDNKKLLPLVNTLYKHEVSLFNNHFLPTFKLIQKERAGSKIIKRHAIPETPYQRVMQSEHIDQSTKDKLEKTHRTLDPFKLQDDIQNRLKQINHLVNLSSKQKRKAV